MATKTENSTDKLHSLPADLRQALNKNQKALHAWHDITPLARNEWICWVTAPKKTATRVLHIKRAAEDLAAGKRRPCCWAGCPHR